MSKKTYRLRKGTEKRSLHIRLILGTEIIYNNKKKKKKKTRKGG